jgi:5-(carboxyamino)imidazole ribonucleotide mutase
MAKIGIIIGSDSDLPVLEKGLKILDDMKILYDLRILSAHRTPEAVTDYVKSAGESGTKVFIAGAGKAAHLPGVVASQTLCPVIGLPIKASLDGLDALLSIVQMPGGIPVATVGINASDNAVLLALQILGTHDKTIFDALVKHRESMKNKVLEKNQAYQKKG